MSNKVQKVFGSSLCCTLKIGPSTRKAVQPLDLKLMIAFTEKMDDQLGTKDYCGRTKVAVEAKLKYQIYSLTLRGAHLHL